MLIASRPRRRLTYRLEAVPLESPAPQMPKPILPVTDIPPPPTIPGTMPPTVEPPLPPVIPIPQPTRVEPPPAPKVGRTKQRLFGEPGEPPPAA